MTRIFIEDKIFEQISFNNEAELEKVVVQNYQKIFGENTYYFDLKKGIRHNKGNLITIPDGYVIKFNQQPSLVIIENELSTHDPVEHIGIHFLKYSSAITEASKYPIKKFLMSYLDSHQEERAKVEKLMERTPYKTISELLDFVVIDQDFEYAIVIDEKTEELERVVRPYEPEIIVLKKFQNNDQVIYHLDGDIDENEISIKSVKSKNQMRKLPDIDTIVCPAQEDGFNEVFLKENRWFAVRIKSKRIPKIKYLAMYEKSPISAIRYIGKVKEIKPYKNTSKYEIILDGKAEKIPSIVLSKEHPTLAPQAPRYTVKSLMDKAKKLEDIFTAKN